METKTELVLCHLEFDDMIDVHLCLQKPEDGSDEISKWLRKGKTASMTIGLTLSVEMVKNV